jgi:FkbM family methyltransferase
MTVRGAVLERAHHGAMALIKRAPVGAPFLFRSYNYVLKQRGNFVAHTRFGAAFACNTDDLVSRTILYFGVWEPNNTAAFGEILRPGDLFVDVGANIGYYSLLASRLVGDEGAVVSIEASPAIFEQLGENVARNHARNVRMVNVAVSDRPGELTLYGGSKWNRGSSSTLPGALRTVEAVVLAAPLDDVLTDDERSRVRLIKIDIEGAELPVLRRLLDTLDRYPEQMHLIVEMAPQTSGDALAEVFDRLVATRFDAFWIENDYETDWYLKWRKPAAPVPVDRLPDEQGDILFRPRTR